ncbi:hypothetical protein Tco_1243440 [Tanacetum coccineum]
MMTKVTDLEANLEQFKIEQAAINSKAAKQRALLQATIEKNKVEAESGNSLKSQCSSGKFPVGFDLRIFEGLHCDLSKGTRKKTWNPRYLPSIKKNI